MPIKKGGNVKLSLILVAAFSIIAGCAVRGKPTVNNSREIASITQNCKLMKHDTENMYQIIVDGKPFNHIWYSKPEMDTLKKRLVKKNICH